MKNAASFPIALLLLAALFITQIAHAQWSPSTAPAIYQADLNKKVGIGLNNPSFMLHVNGTMGINSPAITSFGSSGGLFLQNATAGTYLSLDAGKIQASKSGTGPSGFLTVQANSLLLNPYGGTVGIATTTPVEARFVVNGAVNQTVAMFGQGAPGISLTNGWPGVGFNAYVGKDGNNLVWKAMSTGYGMRLECDPTTGRISFSQNGYVAANGTVTQATTPFAIEPTGKITIGGSGNAKLTVVSYQNSAMDNTLTLANPTLGPNQSHVHWGLKGDWYIRSAANDGIVVIQDNAGGVGIGTANVAGFKLAVNGSIRAKEIRVQTGWADYVFADDYKLRPLAEVETFINTNKHLPEIQSAAEIQENGLDVAATTTKMMAKIEELTLYLIDLKKENDALKTRVEQLETAKQ